MEKERNGNGYPALVVRSVALANPMCAWMVFLAENSDATAEYDFRTPTIRRI